MKKQYVYGETPVRPEMLKLGDDEVLEIRRANRAREKTQKELADEYGVSRSLIGFIVRGTAYPWVKDNSYVESSGARSSKSTSTPTPRVDQGGHGRDRPPVSGNVPRRGDGARTLIARSGMPSLFGVTPREVLDHFIDMDIPHPEFPRFGEGLPLAVADIIAMHRYKRPLTIEELQALVEVSVECPFPGCDAHRGELCQVTEKKGAANVGTHRSPHRARINVAKRRGFL